MRTPGAVEWKIVDAWAIICWHCFSVCFCLLTRYIVFDQRFISQTCVIVDANAEPHTNTPGVRSCFGIWSERDDIMSNKFICSRFCFNFVGPSLLIALVSIDFDVGAKVCVCVGRESFFFGDARVMWIHQQNNKNEDKWQPNECLCRRTKRRAPFRTG